MTHKAKQSLVEDTISLLVRHFGVDEVRAALARASNDSVVAAHGRLRDRCSRPNFQTSLPVASMLEHLQEQDEEKFRLLDGFYAQLKARTLLPESQDIRFFAQMIGLKEISGKSRKDMIPKLMYFLLEQSTEQIKDYVERAASVSEHNRRQGFSVLTDKLLADK